eukprot:Gregarina_sp_Poly_1__520@NODE_1126_length_5010_cov_45_168521_g690_i2_p9_GENE_NODE_1126_length_5010_cov_45_168521_g690_i2NODE_1126_length_5010_cov_45_168521_g690_i2_p9_ORF_typecomplete_len104_score8_91_NODE_1126_length_5010_cov_45_168521_g690_i2185496
MTPSTFFANPATHWDIAMSLHFPWPLRLFEASMSFLAPDSKIFRAIVKSRSAKVEAPNLSNKQKHTSFSHLVECPLDIKACHVSPSCNSLKAFVTPYIYSALR